MNPIVVMTAGLLAVGVPFGERGSQEPGAQDISELAATLDLTETGVRRWLERLGARDRETERLLATSLTGAVLMARDGGGSSVRIDSDMDRLLLEPAQPVVLIHNHPASVGLSAADLRQLGKRGLAAIVAIGHDGSVFMASAGPRLDRDFFEERQYAVASEEVLKALRTEWSSGKVPREASTDLVSHLVTMALARAGVVRYWSRLRGAGRESFDRSRMVFSRVVVTAAGRLGSRLQTGVAR